MSIHKRTFFFLGAFLLFLFIVFLKVNFHARNECQKGQYALQKKHFKQAITHFNRAIHWYSPGSKAVKNSIQALWKIGTQAEKRGNYDLALQAFRELRSSLYSARSFYTPHSEWIKRCDEQIATIIARKKGTGSPDKKISFQKRKQEVLRILKLKTGADVFWSLLCEVGFLGWIGFSIIFIFRTFTKPRGFNARQAILWGIFTIFFYALWIVSMLKA